MARNVNKAKQLAQDMTFKEFSKLSWSEQKKITSVLVSAMNKRIKRLTQTEVGRLSPTYQAFEERGYKYYSIKGLQDSHELYNRFYAMKRSLERATSVREWKKQRNETLTKLDLKGIDVETERAFWSLYRKFQEDNDNFKKYKKEVSDMVQVYIANELDRMSYVEDIDENGNVHRDYYTMDNKEKLKRWLKESYEKSKSKKYQQNIERGLSTIIPDEESE